jgi:hypothetical protein
MERESARCDERDYAVSRLYMRSFARSNDSGETMESLVVAKSNEVDELEGIQCVVYVCTRWRQSEGIASIVDRYGGDSAKRGEVSDVEVSN